MPNACELSPSPVSSRCFPSRQDGEVLCTAAVRPSLCPVFPSPCGQRLDTCTGACGVTAAAVCPGRGTELPRRREAGRLLMVRVRQAALARARAVTAVRLSAQRSADRSVQPRSKRRCAAGLPPPCAGLPGDVLAPHRLGNALEQTLRLASPHRPPRGSRRKAPAPLRSARATGSSRPYTPSRGFCGSLSLLNVSGITAPAGSCSGASLRTGLPLNTVSAYHGEMGRSACTYPSAVFPPSSEDFEMYCRRAPASRLGPAAHTSKTATTGWPPAQAVGQARQASVLAIRPCQVMGISVASRTVLCCSSSTLWPRVVPIS